MKKSKKEKPSVNENPDMVGECQDKQKKQRKGTETSPNRWENYYPCPET